MNTSNTPRRLSQTTHDLCARALSGEFGRKMTENYAAIVDAANYATMTPYEQYNACISAIVEQCPLWLFDGELLCGSATFNKAREHHVPAVLKDTEDPSKALFRSVSHLTPHYQKVIKRGIRGIEDEIELSLKKNQNRPERVAYLEQMQVTVAHLKRWHSRYLQALQARIAETTGQTQSRWQTINDTLCHVPMEPARNFGKRSSLFGSCLLFSACVATGQLWAESTG